MQNPRQARCLHLVNMEPAFKKNLRTLNGWKINWLRFSGVVTVVVHSTGGCVSYQNSCGRGNYQGTCGGVLCDSTKQGGAAGSSNFFAFFVKGTVTAYLAEAAVDPEALCAHMNLEISHDRESELLLHPQTVHLTTWDESNYDED
jgi:hypothetical protein